MLSQSGSGENEQMSALRQNKPLTKDQQADYFKQIIESDFRNESTHPNNSTVCHEKKLIGYGGLGAHRLDQPTR